MKQKQVLLSKYLYESALDLFNPDDAYSCGLAVSMLQDSVESLISTIAVELDAQIKTHSNFFQLWEAVENAKLNKENKILPHKGSMVKLNTARVGFKHHGNLPDASDVEKHIMSAGKFLRQASTEFLGISFDDTSLADLIQNTDVRGVIKEAEEKYKNSEWNEVHFLCAKAENVAMRSFDSVLPEVRINLSGSYEASELLHELELDDVFFKLTHHMNLQRDMLIILTIGTQMSDYLRFRSLVPGVFQSINGKWQGHCNRTIYTKQDSDFCIKFATKHAINMQNRLGHTA